jgi:hypothetical protein
MNEYEEQEWTEESIREEFFSEFEPDLPIGLVGFQVE